MKNQEKTFVTRDREAGNVIETFATLEQAAAAIANYEQDDKAKGIYTADLYEVYEVMEENTAQHTAEWPVEMMYHSSGKLCYYVGEASSKAEERERAALIRKAPSLAAEVDRLREENERLKRELNAANELLNDGREGRGE